jgi:aerobic-type carbon monoxide dehydrogenase small subunit (CoxS/CutS family)
MKREAMADIACEVNGAAVEASVPVRRSLVDWLRHDLGLIGSHVGCEQGVCGACHVVVGGRVVRGCLMLAVQADGQPIRRPPCAPCNTRSTSAPPCSAATARPA